MPEMGGSCSWHTSQTVQGLCSILKSSQCYIKGRGFEKFGADYLWYCCDVLYLTVLLFTLSLPPSTTATTTTTTSTAAAAANVTAATT